MWQCQKKALGLGNMHIPPGTHMDTPRVVSKTIFQEPIHVLTHWEGQISTPCTDQPQQSTKNGSWLSISLVQQPKESLFFFSNDISPTNQFSELKQALLDQTTGQGLRFSIFLISLFFNWKIIALQSFVGFCHTTTWISHRYTYVPFFLKLPPISRPIPPL